MVAYVYALAVPPMRKSSPATYCMRSCCWQHPSTPMIQPKRMMDTAMPTKPAVILLRSASKGRCHQAHQKSKDCWLKRVLCKEIMLVHMTPNLEIKEIKYSSYTFSLAIRMKNIYVTQCRRAGKETGNLKFTT